LFKGKETMKHKLIYSCLILLVIAGFAACRNTIQPDSSISAQYFPNKVGDSWTYMVDDTVGENLQVSIIGSTSLPDGIPVSIWKWVWPGNMNPKVFGTDTTYVVISGDTVEISSPINPKRYPPKSIKDLPIRYKYIFPLETGNNWIHDADSSRVVSKDSLTVPAGMFNGVYKIHTHGFSFNYRLDRDIWFKPGVGLVKMNQILILGDFNGSLKLVDYHVK